MDIDIKNKKKSLNILVLGSGSWGTSLALAANKNYSTCLWSRDSNQVQSMYKNKENSKYLPGIRLPKNLKITDDIDNSLFALSNKENKSLIIVSVPISGIKNICSILREKITKLDLLDTPIIWTSKGFENHSGNLLHETVEQNLNITNLKYGILSGPSFAKEVALELPTALTIASKNTEVCELVIQTLHSESLRVYSSHDIIGVEVGGALKNVIAIACGISDGLKLGSNARAALITRGLHEIKRFGIALGAQETTFLGLSCLGDLVLTSTGNLSRNRNIGIQIGQGFPINEVINSNITTEGVRCALAIKDRARKLNIELPIIETVCSILFEQLDPKQAVSILLQRKYKI
ncbi:glycerol-3-phosphate dehydrogenase (NAD(P)+) [Angomonas deanei]|nr:glycerol-3-phosphate dehydrogenase (NAD(P)+) [Angomonas deanei]|eukprot:EPY35971.1 glycerol-3-phosphate dehydrogenase (NAD(P)+) [Angomonas deanei]